LLARSQDRLEPAHLASQRAYQPSHSNVAVRSELNLNPAYRSHAAIPLRKSGRT
jgi:hypothetical protein